MSLTIEQRVAALEARISPEGEAVVPTYLSVDPTTGVVTANFAGGVTMQEAADNFPLLPLPSSAVRWVDTNQSVRDYIQGIITGGLILSTSRVNGDNCYIQMTPSSIIALTATGAGTASILIIDPTGKSNFIQNSTGSGRKAVLSWGVLNSDGTVNNGSGDFTSVKNSTGNYTVTFTNAISIFPMGTASIFQASSYVAVFYAISTTQATIQTFVSSTGASVDATVSFLAIWS